MDLGMLTNMLVPLKKLILIIPVMVAFSMVHVFICATCSMFVGLQLVIMGVDKTLSFVVSLVIALGLHTFIVMNHRIRDFINQRR